jgi:hypothetical protein
MLFCSTPASVAVATFTVARLAFVVGVLPARPDRCAWPNQALPNAVPRLCGDKKRGAHPEENADGRNRPRSRRRRPVKETNKKKRRWGRRTRRAHVRSLPRPASGKRRDNSRRWRFGAAAFGWHGMMRRTRVGTPGAQAGHGTHPPIARRQERSESWALLFLFVSLVASSLSLCVSHVPSTTTAVAWSSPASGRPSGK